MENFVEQIKNRDYDTFVSGIESLTSLFSEIPDSLLEKILPILKAKLSEFPNSLRLILEFFAKLSKQDSFSLYFPNFVPELIFQFANASNTLRSSIFALLYSFSLKNDLSPYLIQYGLSNDNYDIKTFTIKLIKELYKVQKAPELLIKTLRTMSSDSTEILKTLASEALDSIFKLETEKNFEFLKEFQFSSIPHKIIEKVLFSLNSNEKYANLQLLEEIITSLESLKSLPILSLLHILSKALEDTNFKISLISLNIAYFVLSNPSILIPESSIQIILPSCIKKLGDNKISVRQSAHKLFRLLLKINILEVVSELLPALESPNWHIREESLSVLIVAMLIFPSSYDFTTLIPFFAKLLDDSRTKIRVTSTEALAVLNSIYGENIVSAKLKDIVDDKAFEGIIQRFKQKNLPTLTDEYITFKSNSKAPETISSRYFFQSSINSYKSPLASYEKIIPDTPTSAETSTEPKIIRKSMSSNKYNKNLVSSFRIGGTLPQTVKDNPNYIPFDKLDPVVNPSESLQKCIFYSEN